MSRSKRPKGKNRPRRYHHGRNIDHEFRTKEPLATSEKPDAWDEPTPLRSNGTGKVKRRKQT